MEESSKKNNLLDSRKSNYELMRIISMFLIILYHIILHGKLITRSEGIVKMILGMIEAIILMHVNSFIILTGYFQCKSTRKMKKVFSIIGQTWFYKVAIMLILIKISYIITPRTIDYIHTLLPLDYGTYWYVNCYLILYIISPILNKVINNSNKKELQQTILTLFIIVSCISTLTRDIVFNSFIGRSISTFILLYFIGAYLRLYPLEQSKFFKKYKPSNRRLLYFIGFLITILISYSFWLLGIYLTDFNNILKYIGKIFNKLHISYASPIVIIQTLFYFSIFGTFSFKNKFINLISQTTLGVYLIHENYYLRSILYYKLKLKYSPVTYSKIGYIIIVAIIMYIICIIIELIRKILIKIFNYIIKKIIEFNKNKYWRISI
ncbi:MAG: acyltransferase [Bacilli bacterium]|nr:acyltransferase [Bacilli bacterium]MBR3162393.1 acyltransferase [Bacilli bacterium]